jgi:hypothetical protein
MVPNIPDEIKAQLETLTSLVKTLITKVETRIPMVDGFDDRITRIESLAKAQANIAFKLAAAKALTSWVPGAVAGAIAGAVAAITLMSLFGRVAMAH